MTESIQDVLQSTPVQKCDLGNGETLTWATFGQPDTAKHKLLVLAGYGADAVDMAAIWSVPLPDHHVVGVNLRGVCGSTNHQGCFSHHDNAKDVALFLDKVGLADVFVLGFSTGGGVAAELALLCPQKIKATFLLNSVALNGVRHRQGMDPQGAFCTTRQDIQDLVTGPVFQALHSQDFDTHFSIVSAMAAPQSLDPQVTAFALYAKSCPQIVSRQQQQVANLTFNLTPMHTPAAKPSFALKELQAPMFVINAAQDVAVNHEQVRTVTRLAILEEWAPTGKLHYYELDGGHFNWMADFHPTLDLYHSIVAEHLVVAKESSSE